MYLDYSDYNPKEKGFERRKPGKALLLVHSLEESEEGGDFYKLRAEVLAHEDETEVGKVWENRLYCSGRGAKRLQYFLEAIGILTEEVLDELIASGQSGFEFDEQDAVGQVFFGVFEEGEYESRKSGKTVKTCNVEFEFLHVDDPWAADFPRDGKYVKQKKSDKQMVKEKKGKQNKEKEAEVPSGDDDCPF